MRKSRAASGFFALAAVAVWTLPAKAAASAWAQGEGASVRLVVVEPPDAQGHLRGMLDIALKPGWKTYWREPGSAGVPPSLDVSGSLNVAAAVLQFPAPERHDDGFGAWAGYSGPVALPVLLTLDDPAKPATVEAAVFLGLCKDICIPFSAHLSVEVAGGDDADDDRDAVDAAFADLPKAAEPGFSIEPEGLNSDTLTLAANLPDENAAEAPTLFLAGGEGLSFGVPEPARTGTAGNGKSWRFAVPVLDRPAGGAAAEVFYTLVTAAGAVSGTFRMP